MAKLYTSLTEDELKKINVINLRKEYKKLSDFLGKIYDGEIIKCNKCGEWKSAYTFYQSRTSPDGIEHYACKSCILDECTDYDKRTKIRTDNKQKAIEAFRRLNWYFNEVEFEKQLNSLREATGEKIRSTAIQQWIVMIKSLPNWKNLTFEHSEFLDTDTVEINRNKKPRKEIIKIFGSGFTNEDYLYLQDQYDDWKSRTQVDSKSQETYIVRICFKLLDIYKAQKMGRDTDKLDKSLNELMASANLQPRQNIGEASTDTLTFGQLIEKWEEEKPISEPAPEFKDVDGIGKYIRVWFKGHLARALGLDNGYSKEYDEYIKDYTVTKQDYDEDGRSDDIYNSLFGKDGE